MLSKNKKNISKPQKTQSKLNNRADKIVKVIHMSSLLAALVALLISALRGNKLIDIIVMVALTLIFAYAISIVLGAIVLIFGGRR